MRNFTLYRHDDETGVSGTGTVAEGVEFTDGRVAIRWCVGDNKSTTLFDTIANVEAIHGHGGKTEIVWDGQNPQETYTWKAADFEMRYDKNHTFPFIEDEDAIALYGYGHHNKDTFAQHANRYDMIAGGLNSEDANYNALSVEHLYARPIPGTERFTWKDINAATSGAFPITIIFR